MGDVNEPTVVFIGDYATAGMVMSRLEDAGIEASIWDNALPTLTGSSLTVRVAIRQQDVERARPLLQDFESR